ncbi:alpha/beta hydrolase [Spirulina major]|uniref:alpha/beta hydrolase n=1 Tax=Spirulina major TaxID=270636 RepID=UPI000935528B|nr:alpha/beta hydrolase [Spirulina major]
MKQWWRGVVGVLVMPLGVLVPGVAIAAETIVFNFGPLEFSIAVESLEQYAATGKIAPDFQDVAARLSDEQLTELRTVLSQRAPVDPITISQFLYSPQGEVMLRQVGELILTRQRVSGFYALRSALILAAADPEEGLTPLNVLRKFPVKGLRINSALAFELVSLVSRKTEETDRAIAVVESIAAEDAIAQSTPPLPSDLRTPGPFNFEVQEWQLNDSTRQREFLLTLYLPEQNLRGNAPVVVISHGLGSTRQTFAYLAEHLVSYGFAVAVPEHPGSNGEQLAALASGLAREITPPEELLDRPQDITLVLDWLTQQYGDRLNLEKVGVIGQSFGAYTALALAGAGINQGALAAACPDSLYALNLSLVLQCAALKLPQFMPPAAPPSLRDERVQAAIAINPLSSEIFGPEELAKIAIPTMIVSGSADTVTPALDEQILPFTALQTPERYLVLLRNGTHFSTLGATDEDVELPPAVLGPDPAIAQDYMRSLGVAFFGLYIAGTPNYRPYLRADYGQSLSNTAMPMSVINTLTPDQLKRR